MVERKGIGHPDTICDLVMEEISSALCKLFLRESGRIQHYNMDKALLAAGEAENKFGGGKILKPMKLIFGDRATFSTDQNKFDVDEVAAKAAASWFEMNFRYVGKEHIQYQFEIGSASQQLRAIFNKKGYTGHMAAANDTSALVGYAPITRTESAVLKTEQYVNSPSFKSEFPESGEDIKVMGFRKDDDLELTIAMAFVDLHINSKTHYFTRKKEMLQAIREFHGAQGYFDETNIIINNLDDQDSHGMNGMYLTVLGTSADSSDSGEVGRGNRANK